jgi:hypothetical protein
LILIGFGAIATYGLDGNGSNKLSTKVGTYYFLCDFLVVRIRLQVKLLINNIRNLRVDLRVLNVTY